MNIFKVARLLALDAVLHPETDPQYELRRIFREYSEMFHTPLHVVEDLPIDYVLQNYYEKLYERMEGREVDDKDADQRSYLVRERDLLVETDAEREARLLKEHQDHEDDEEFFQEVKREAKTARERAEQLKQQAAALKQTVTEEFSGLVEKSVAHERALLKLAEHEDRGLPLPESLELDELKPGRKLPEDVEIKFEIGDESELDD